ncbi:MAG: hypothetical protein M5R40_23395 [Anaerolineae bacterium]|nr:hypothetical protein [Anaerolineae bacterium]
MNVRWNWVDFSIPAPVTDGDARARVIGAIPGQIVTENLAMEIPAANGRAQSDTDRDILKIAVIERHRASGNVGKGFIHGFGLKRGAIAGTIAHDHHNLVVIGVDDESMWTAARSVGEMDGGLAVAVGDQTLAGLPLPIAGLMSDQPIEEVSATTDLLTETAQELGCQIEDPFMAMSFMALEVIPALKLTDLGLVDVQKFDIVDLWV